MKNLRDMTDNELLKVAQSLIKKLKKEFYKNYKGDYPEWDYERTEVFYFELALEKFTDYMKLKNAPNLRFDSRLEIYSYIRDYE